MWPEGQWEALETITLRLYERIGLRADSLKNLKLIDSGPKNAVNYLNTHSNSKAMPQKKIKTKSKLYININTTLW